MRNCALALLATLLLTSCSTIRELWPRPHDAVLFDHLVRVDVTLDRVDCDKPNWQPVADQSEVLARYAEWRRDPQATNLRGLHQHAVKMSAGGSKMFCELGKKTAHQRIAAARTAMEGR